MKQNVPSCYCLQMITYINNSPLIISTDATYFSVLHNIQIWDEYIKNWLILTIIDNKGRSDLKNAFAA